MYCTHKTEILGHEGRWLSLLICMQIIKVVIFSIWQAKLTEWKQYEMTQSAVKTDKLFAYHQFQYSQQSFG